MADEMKRKSTPKYQGSLKNFADNEDGHALLIPGKQLSNNDSTNPNGNLHHLTKFNRFDLPEGFLHLGGLRGYIFMTRPDLNLMDEKNVTSLKISDQNKNKIAIRELLVRGTAVDKEAMSALQQNSGFASPFMPIFTTFCKGFTPEDQSLDVLEKGETHHGMRIKYGKHTGQSRSSGSFTLTLEDSKFLPVFKTLAIWTDYIEQVYLGDITPKQKYIRDKILDYAVSMFYVVTKQDATEIVYWDKKLGVFPKNRPDSAFATSKSQFTHPEYSVTFEYSMSSKSSVLDPVVLSEINTLSGFTKIERGTGTANTLLSNLNTYYPTYDLVNNRIGTPLVNGPKIEFSKGKFYLRWI